MPKAGAMKTLPFILLALAALALASCNATTLTSVASTAGIWLTKPGAPPPADTKDQIAQHESWCYETLAEPVCYAHPQDVDPNRLINVDPESRYPLTAQEYTETVLADEGLAPTHALAAPPKAPAVTPAAMSFPAAGPPSLLAPPASGGATGAPMSLIPPPTQTETH